MYRQHKECPIFAQKERFSVFQVEDIWILNIKLNCVVKGLCIVHSLLLTNGCFVFCFLFFFQQAILSQNRPREVSRLKHICMYLVSVRYRNCFCMWRLLAYHWCILYFGALDRSGVVCRVKYCNTLPDIPFDPKFITYPFDQHRYSFFTPLNGVNTSIHFPSSKHV